MPKQHVEKLGKIEDFQAPWETDAGEVEIDKDRLKRFIFNMKLSEAKAFDKLEEKDEQITTLTSEKGELQKQVEAKGDPDLAKELEAERAKTAEEKARADKAEHRLLVAEVAAEKGLTPAQAKRLAGETKDELEKDADELLETFGVAKGDEDEEGEESVLRTHPRRPTNPGDPDSSKVVREPDYEKVVAGFNRTFI